MLDPELLAALACPICKGELELKDDNLICHKDGLKFPIVDDIPVLLKEEALPLDSEGDQ